MILVVLFFLIVMNWQWYYHYKLGKLYHQKSYLSIENIIKALLVKTKFT